MRELSFNEARKIELDILLHIHEFCKANNLTYFLAYGTLLGAIRHKGFIPWDDDIDIMLPRKDYDWLIENYNVMNPNGRYKLISPDMPESRHSFVKFIDTYTVKVEPNIDYRDGNLGVDVDVFPIDGQPDDEDVFVKWHDELMMVYKIYGLCLANSKVSMKRRLAVPIIKIIMGGCKAQIKKARALHNKYPYKNAKYVGVTECAFVNKRDRYEKECVAQSVEMEFEGYNFLVPIGYDRVLTKIYGDYMQLPPEEKRVTHHSNKMYLKD